MSNLNLKGLWILIEILTDKNLSDKEKYIYSLVIFLSQEKQYCFCTNKTITELLNISVTQVSKLVNSLKDKGYINIEMIYKKNSKEVEIRKLIPIEEKFKDNKYNKNINNKANFEQRDYSNFDWNSLYANGISGKILMYKKEKIKMYKNVQKHFAQNVHFYIDNNTIKGKVRKQLTMNKDDT